MSDPEEKQTAVRSRPLLVVPDANVLVHGKALCNLPWNELDREEIEIWYVMPVVKEIDKLKTFQNKQGKIARDVSNDFRTLLRATIPVGQVRKAGPKVSKRLDLRDFTESKSPSLKLEHADQNLVNYALHLRDEGNDVLLLTDDTICAATAMGHGLEVKLIAENWIREPEPDELSKENAKLKEEVQRLKTAEPKISLGFTQADGVALDKLEATLVRWPALTGEEIAELLDEIRRGCPPAIEFVTTPPVAEMEAAAKRRLAKLGFGPYEAWEGPTEAQIKNYQTKIYPEWIESIKEELTNLHTRFSAQIRWPEFRLVASNVGVRPALDAMLRISSRGDLVLSDLELEGYESVERPKMSLPAPPKPPRGYFKKIDPLGLHDIKNITLPRIAFDLPEPRMLRSVTRDDRQENGFYWRTLHRLAVDEMEIECASWRHADREIVFSLAVVPKRLDSIEGAVEVTVHATNLSVPKTERLPIRLSVKNASTLEEARALVKKLLFSAQFRLP